MTWNGVLSTVQECISFVNRLEENKVKKPNSVKTSLIFFNNKYYVTFYLLLVNK